MNKKEICVLFGGNSSEHDISVISAKNVIANLDRELYNIHMIYITRKGEWKLCIDSPDNPVYSAVISPDSSKKAILVFKNGGYEEIKIDAVFIVLHGKNGEDGTVQGLLELADIPYAGCGVLANALCMDKAMAKYIFSSYNIPQVEWLLFTPDDSDDDILSRTNEKFKYPVFVKPSRVGSSFGTAKVEDSSQLLDAVHGAFEYDSKVLIEEFINAREVECAVMGNGDPKAAKLGEIVVKKNAFYDFEAKYQGDGCDLFVPAPVDKETERKIKEYAIKAYKAAGCEGFSRVDFFISKDNGSIYLNEINTIPGFTDGSLFPIAWRESGSPVKQTLTTLINLAFEKKGK